MFGTFVYSFIFNKLISIFVTRCYSVTIKTCHWVLTVYPTKRIWISCSHSIDCNLNNLQLLYWIEIKWYYILAWQCSKNCYSIKYCFIYYCLSSGAVNMSFWSLKWTVTIHAVLWCSCVCIGSQSLLNNYSLRPII